MKKILSVLIVLALTVSLCAGALAAGGPEDRSGKIVITNAVKGAEYHAYRLFDLTFNEISQAYSYTVTEKWKGFIAQETISGRNGYVQVDEIDGKQYITWIKGETEAEKTAFAAEFARLALDYANDPAHKIEQDASAVGTIRGTGCTAEFENLLHGYYLVDTSVGSLCHLDSTHPDFTVEDKSTAPESAKSVKEADTWGNKNDANIGDVVEFKSEITVQQGAENYVMRDSMGNGLLFTGVTKVTRKAGGDPLKEETLDNTGNEKYAIIDGTKTTFGVKFENAYLETLSPGDILTVYYTAELTDTAEIRTERTEDNKNTSWLEYGHNTDILTTLPSETVTRTWDFKIHKYAVKDQEEIPLAKAVFRLHRDTESGTLVNFVKSDPAGTYKVCTKDDSAGGHVHLTELSTEIDGNLHLEGLDSGVYYLEETKAPDGYNKLKDPIKITIGSNGEIEHETFTCNDLTVKIENKSGSELPSTGGIGTAVFYILGTVLIAAAVVLIVTKRKYFAK